MVALLCLPVSPLSHAIVLVYIVHVPSPPPPCPSPHVPPSPPHKSLIPLAWHSHKPPLLQRWCMNEIPLNSGRWRTAPTHIAFPILFGFFPGLSSQSFPWLVSTHFPQPGLPPGLCPPLSQWSPVPTQPLPLIPHPPWNSKFIG